MFINCLVTFLPIGSHLLFERSLNKNHSIGFFFFFPSSFTDASIVLYICSCLLASYVIVYVGSHLQQQESSQRKTLKEKFMHWCFLYAKP